MPVDMSESNCFIHHNDEENLHVLNNSVHNQGKFI